MPSAIPARWTAPSAISSARSYCHFTLAQGSGHASDRAGPVAAGGVGDGILASGTVVATAVTPAGRTGACTSANLWRAVLFRLRRRVRRVRRRTARARVME